MTGEAGAIRIEMFGGLRISRGETSYTRFSAQQTGALLALLALNLHRPCTREELAAALWPDVDAGEARRRLRQALFKLRQQLAVALPFGEEPFLRLPNTIQMNPDRIATDVSEFERAVLSAQCSHEMSERIRHLVHADTLYQGELLPGYYSEVIIAEQHRLDCLFQTVLHGLVTSLTQTGKTADAVDIAVRAIDRDPTSEQAHCDLMRVFAAQGKPLAVMRQYKELERLFQEAFDEQPSVQTRDLAASLQAQASLHRDASLAPGRCMDDCRGRAREDIYHTLWAGLAPPACTPTQPHLDPVTKPQVLTPRVGSGFAVTAPQRPAPLAMMPRRDAPGVAGVIVTLLLLLGVGAPLIARLRLSTAALRAGSIFIRPIPPPVRTASFVGAGAAARHPITKDVHPPFAHVVTGRQFARLSAAIRHKPLHRARMDAGPVRPRAATRVTARPIRPGTELWERRVELKPGDRGNDVTAVIPDPTGGVFVLGFVYTAKTDVDFLIVKYSAAGKVLWERRYDGPGHDTDRARSGAVDAEGNLYVTGESDGGKGDGKGNHNAWDVETLKYDRNGNKQWERRWRGPGNNEDAPVKLCLDAHRNVYVTARSNFGDPPKTCYDWITLKYDTHGNQKWCQRFGGPGDDEPTDMAVDRAGNVYVTGYESLHGLRSCVVVKYSTAGRQERAWTCRAAGFPSARPTGIALDRDGNVIIAATAYLGAVNDLLVLKYDRHGRARWFQSYHLGVANVAEATGIAIDRCGRVCVAATAHGSPTGACDTILATVFDTNGRLLWVNLVEGEAHRSGRPCAAAADAEGDFIVLGTVDNGKGEGRHTAEDYVSVKYGPNGTEPWRNYFNGSLSGGDFARALTVDSHDRVYVAGQSDPCNGKPNTIVTVKYAP